MQVTKWHKCYDEGWKGVIVPEAFAHPAKMSYGLLKRILAHAQGWLGEGAIILDPFGGIGSTGILGAYEGYQVVCVELEAKFCKLAEQNFELHKDAWVEFGNPFPIILQGDSRRLCEVVEKADCIVSSPPFAGNTGGHGKASQNAIDPKLFKRHLGSMSGIKSTPGQLGAMKPGKVDMVVSSPPFSETVSQQDPEGIKGQNLKERTNPRHPGEKLYFTKYAKQKSPGNLGNLKSGDVNLILSSPPYEGSLTAGGHLVFRPGMGDVSHKDSKGKDEIYGHSENQLGNQQGDTFWQAAKLIVEQCHQILKPGGHAIWVVKSFVRKGKIVDFPGDWRRLCEAAGFKTVCIHHAMLVKETSHKTLFGHTEVKRKERKSFFRRLAESKGSPRIDFECVLCMEKQPCSKEKEGKNGY